MKHHVKRVVNSWKRVMAGYWKMAEGEGFVPKNAVFIGNSARLSK